MVTGIDNSSPASVQRCSARAMRGGAMVLAIAVLLASLAGCSTEQAESSIDPVFAELIDTAIEDARDGGASTEQVAMLEKAKEAGEVTLEQARDVMRVTIECFVDSGFEAEYIEDTEPTGFVVPGYRVWRAGELSSNDDIVIDRCDFESNFWVTKVYQTQPSSSQLWIDFVNARAEELRVCLEDAEYETDPDATGAELAQQAAAVAAETEFEVNCLEEIGAF